MAIFTLLAIVIVLALVGRITQLASATSLLLLMVFGIVNAALIVLKYRPGEAQGAFEVPTIVPLIGALCCGGLMAARLGRVVSHPEENWQAPTIAGSLVLVIGLTYFLYVYLRKGGHVDMSHIEEAGAVSEIPE